jgi:hypothetical protein
VSATYASAGRAMSGGRFGLAMDFTDEDRRQARGGESKKNNKEVAPITARTPVAWLRSCSRAGAQRMSAYGSSSDRLRELQRPPACRSDCGNDRVLEIGLIDAAPVSVCRVPHPSTTQLRFSVDWLVSRSCWRCHRRHCRRRAAHESIALRPTDQPPGRSRTKFEDPLHEIV